MLITNKKLHLTNITVIRFLCNRTLDLLKIFIKFKIKFSTKDEYNIIATIQFYKRYK